MKKHQVAFGACMIERFRKAHRLFNLHQARWQKLIWNIPYNGLSVLLGAGTTALMADADSRALIQALMAEVRAELFAD